MASWKLWPEPVPRAAFTWGMASMASESCLTPVPFAFLHSPVKQNSCGTWVDQKVDEATDETAD